MSVPELSSRTELIQPSPTLAMGARAKAMCESGINVISMAQGEPDFNTPEPICDAAIDAIRKGITKYTPSSGLPALKKAIVEKFRRENGLGAEVDQIVVSCGAKHSMFNALMCLVNPGDEVILIAPYWMTYRDQIKLAGGTPIVIFTTAETGFVPTSEQLRAAVTPKTKAIIINSPSNPTGAVLGRDTLKEIAALALRHNFWVISDEIYERLIYGQEHQSIAALSKEISDRTITICGCSKTYSMTGWRIGYALSPKAVAQAMTNVQDQVTSNPTSFAQMGAIAALATDDSVVNEMRDEFLARRDLMVSRLRQIPGLDVPVPQGAFYIFAGVGALLDGEIKTDADLSDHLLTQAHVSTIPGSVFDGPGHLRLSFTSCQEDLCVGIDRIAEAVRKL